MNNKIKEIIYGFIFGLSCIIPGFSGGTMLVILGIYESFTNSLSKVINNITIAFKELIFYFIGTFIGSVLGVMLVESLLSKYPFMTSSYFIGLIIPTTIFVIKEIKKNKITFIHYLLFFLFFIISIVISFSKELNIINNNLNNNFIYILLISIISSTALIIPGISGMSILLIFGLYDEIIYNIKSLLSGDWNNLNVLVPFIIGFIIGIILISKLVTKALLNKPNLIWSSVLSLLIVSPFIIYKDIYNDNYLLFNENKIFHIILSFIFIILGILSLSVIKELTSKRS